MEGWKEDRTRERGGGDGRREGRWMEGEEGAWQAFSLAEDPGLGGFKFRD